MRDLLRALWARDRRFKALLILSSLYFLASLGHFAHNAEFICTYPNLPPWLTRGKVYAAWLAITVVGAAGFWLIRRGLPLLGLALVAVYAALGFDGLAHYSVAPMALHPFWANVSILGEVAAAALLLPVVLLAMLKHLRGTGAPAR
jgi:hypothetical protein